MTLIPFLFLTIIGFLGGYGGPLLALYYGGLMVYTIPLGALLGAIGAAIRLSFQLKGRQALETREADHIQVKAPASALYIIIPSVLIAGIALTVLISANATKNVTHGATWLLETQPECDTSAIVLMLEDYGVYEIVCSAELLEYLQSGAADVVPITYRVSYYFGDPSSYQLIDAGPVTLDWDNWIGGGGGCRGPYTLTCDLSSGQPPSPLLESSWPVEP